MRQPSIFLSHGAPTIMVEASPAREAIAALGSQLEKPDAIVIASAHFETKMLEVVDDPNPETKYDFGNFDDRLFDMVYPAKGSPKLAGKIAALLGTAGIDHRLNPSRPYDHGIWTPLMLAFPEADIPVVQVSIQPLESAEHHFNIGRALTKLRDENVLVIGSGHITHNLQISFGAMQGRPFNAEYKQKVDVFVKWVEERLSGNKVQDILNWEQMAPEARFNHPSPEHFMPLFFAYGAGGVNSEARLLHRSTQYEYLTSDIWRFD